MLVTVTFKDFIIQYITTNMYVGDYEQDMALRDAQDATEYRQLKSAIYLFCASSSTGDETMLELLEDYYNLK